MDTRMDSLYAHNHMMQIHNSSSRSASLDTSLGAGKACNPAGAPETWSRSLACGDATVRARVRIVHDPRRALSRVLHEISGLEMG